MSIRQRTNQHWDTPTMDISSYIKEMIFALESNIDYLKKEGGAVIVLKNGLYSKDIAKRFIYVFPSSYFVELEENVEVQVRIQNNNYNANVIQVSDDSIQIEFGEYLGDSIAEVKIVSISYYLLQLLVDKLKNILDGKTKLSPLANKVFLLEPYKNNVGNIDVDYKDLNESQVDALKKAINNEISYVWGPPGTGKTRTISRIIETYIANGKSILLISHTNLATDNALYEVVRNITKREYYEQGKILRVGKYQKKELDRYPYIVPEYSAQELQKPILAKLKEIQDNLRVLKSKHDSILKARDKYQEYEKRTKELNIKKYSLVVMQEESIKSNTRIKELFGRISKARADLDRYNRKGVFGRVFSLISPKKCENVIAISEKGIGGIKDNRASLLTEVKASKKEYYEMKRKYKSAFGNYEYKSLAELNESEKEVCSNIDKAELVRSEFNKQLENAVDELIKNALVLATTLTKSYSNKQVLEREYDCVVIDEASMAPIPAILCAVGLAKEKVIIVGDCYQLPPVTKHKVVNEKDKTQKQKDDEEKAVGKWLKNDIYELVGIKQSIDKGVMPDFVSQLKIQYRMHPKIADVINSLIYGKISEEFCLVSHSTTRSIGNDLIDQEPAPKNRLVVYDTSNVGVVPSRTDSNSCYNIYNAVLAVDLTKKALASGYKSVGIVSPFRAQKTLISKMLEDENIGSEVVVDTVHRFQGGEKQVVIFDLTTSKRTVMTDDNKAGGDDEKLINVAFSRAQMKLLMIADVNTVNKDHSDSSLIRKFIEHCSNENGKVLKAEKYINKYFVSDKSEEIIGKIHNVKGISRELNNVDLYDENDFYRVFILDLLKAKKEVIICSPFVTRDRGERFKDIFKWLMDKDIRVYLLTRSPKQYNGNMVQSAKGILAEYEDMGITVLPFQKAIHQKFAVIDRTLWWGGSLNILSQRDSGEMMERMVGVGVSEQIIKFMNIDRNIGKIGENRLDKCNSCNDVGAWFWTDRGQWGPWTHCLCGNHKKGGKAKSEESVMREKKTIKRLRKQKKEMNDEGIPICPKCNVPMKQRKGRFGEFWGCKNYPRCKVTEKIRQMSGSDDQKDMFI